MKNRLTSFGIVALTPLLLLLCGCGTQKRVVESELPFAKIYTAAWMQRSAEYEALCYQAFNGARLYLDQALAMSQEGDKPLAIITDIDETILDNSPNAVHQGLKGELFDPAEWTEWCAMAVADTVPGAPAFLKYAASEGVEIFYITNRNFNEREGTLLNLQKYDFPFADNDHLLLKGDTSNKDLRREQVLRDFDVVIYMGDQLTDFPGYNALNEKQRSKVACDDMSNFGTIYIVLPNPNYGEWETALFEGRRLDPKAQVEVIKKRAKGY